MMTKMMEPAAQMVTMRMAVKLARERAKIQMPPFMFLISHPRKFIRSITVQPSNMLGLLAKTSHFIMARKWQDILV